VCAAQPLAVQAGVEILKGRRQRRRRRDCHQRMPRPDGADRERAWAATCSRSCGTRRRRRWWG
jgi:hypothetical protein